jgi:hypothetical protein
MAGEEVDEAAWEEYARNTFNDGSGQPADNRKPRRSRKTGAARHAAAGISLSARGR